MNADRSRAVPEALILSSIAMLIDGFTVGFVALTGLFAVMSLLFLPIYIVLAMFKIGRSTTKGLVILLLCPIGPTVVTSKAV